MSSRDEILRRVRRPSGLGTDAPPAFTGGITFADPAAQFGEVLATVGGRCEQAATQGDVRQLLSDLIRDIEARKICSSAPGIELTNFDLNSIRNPHELNDVDLAIMPGRIAVAENAAVWITAASEMERSLFFLTQHLVLVVPQRAVVSNLHEAYDQVDVAAAAFGAWISGPSKTADIEQSLVIGAHGPRSLLVILFGER